MDIYEETQNMLAYINVSKNIQEIQEISTTIFTLGVKHNILSFCKEKFIHVLYLMQKLSELETSLTENDPPESCLSTIESPTLHKSTIFTGNLKTQPCVLCKNSLQAKMQFARKDGVYCNSSNMMKK